jgi:hypothetical protein
MKTVAPSSIVAAFERGQLINRSRRRQASRLAKPRPGRGVLTRWPAPQPAVAGQKMLDLEQSLVLPDLMGCGGELSIKPETCATQLRPAKNWCHVGGSKYSGGVG